MLRKYGCEEIVLLVDYRQAEKSTQEVSGLFVGSAYRLIPVVVPAPGVFHPKVAYFEGETSDTLVVSSGNLTQPGQGNNLETLDAVSSLEHSEVFSELAEFFEILSKKYTFSANNEKLLKSYSERAASWQVETSTSTPRACWLLHTLEQPINTQLLALAGTHVKEPQRLTVLAPYHAPDASPLVRLASQLGNATSLRVGLSAHDLIAPFDAAKVFLPSDTTFVVAETKDSDRLAHAKCFEIVGRDNCLVMTGSVNATIQSLESTRNVEVSLVRKLSASPFVWASATPRNMIACDFRPEGTISTLQTIQASWGLDNVIEGLLLPAVPDGTIELSLWDRDACLFAKGDVLLSNSRFSLPMLEAFSVRGSMRIEVRSSAFFAKGWVNVELELSGSTAERSLLRAVGRLRAGTVDLADLDILLTWMAGQLSEQHQLTEKPLERQHSVQKTQPQAAPEVTSTITSDISYADWYGSTAKAGSTVVSANTAKAALAAALRWLHGDTQAASPTALQASQGKRKLELFVKEGDELKDNRDSPAPSLSPSEAQQAARAANAARQQLFLEGLPELLKFNATGRMVVPAVNFAGISALQRAMSLASLRQGTSPSITGRGALTSWLSKFSQFDYTEDIRDELMPLISALTCCAASWEPQSEIELLCEALQRFTRRKCSAEEIRSAAHSVLTNELAMLVSPDRFDSICETAAALANSPSLSQKLHTLIVNTFEAPLGTRVSYPPAHQSAFTILRQRAVLFAKGDNRRGTRKFGVIPKTKNSEVPCPCCYNGLSKEDFLHLRMVRTAVCKNTTCQSPLFFDLDVEELSANNLQLHFRSLVS